MLRPALGVLIIGASICIGMRLSSRLTRRREILGEYIRLLDEASGRIQYTNGTLAQVFADNFADYRFDPSCAFAPQWERMAARYSGVLNEEDRRLLCRFGEELGDGDVEAQERRFRLCRSLLEERLDDARSACEKKGSLYRNLPFCVGLVLTLLLL